MTKYRDDFISKLKLPTGVWPKLYEGMNRCHFYYHDKGIVTLDICKNFYHLRAKEEYLRAIHITDYTIDSNHPASPGTIKSIPLNDTEVFYKLVDLIMRRESGDDIRKRKRTYRYSHSNKDD